MKAKGLEISGTFSRRQGHMYMDMSFTNKALQHMTDFAIQFNKNRSVTCRVSFIITSEFHSSSFLFFLIRYEFLCSVYIVSMKKCYLFVCLSPLCSFGMIPTSPLPIHTPLMPSQSIDISLPINTIGPVMKMDPLNNLQVGKPSNAEGTCQQGEHLGFTHSVSTGSIGVLLVLKPMFSFVHLRWL